ncbi:MAG: TetR/AcrR family transcriptional regulator [Deltaproteobacteria bacterium]|nr:TetR/AcrR family transcriptional regulator [Deltaproteobacteria bacterium]MBW2042797.1 TetR/AcrR family transcriptional regulator [Deltaproteobacteria bacterium]MBW2131489.1 TetR/AcrR family transcriptional regulator [Deltaproteobacteria bacterium]
MPESRPVSTHKKNSNSAEGIPTQIKNPELVRRRRRQIAEAAVGLFIENGFHKTTTREIARAAGVSIGSLYEYVASKEDVLYLVCESIHEEVERGVAEAMNRAGRGKETLAAVLREYFWVCHRMSDFILLIYQETRSLPPQWRKKVLENELRITGIFVEVLARLAEQGAIPKMDDRSLEIAAHNISVLGHMWTFRRWFLSRHYHIEEYIRCQTRFILNLVGRPA